MRHFLRFSLMKPLLFLLVLAPAVAVSFTATAKAKDPCELRLSHIGEETLYMGWQGYLSVDPKFRPKHYEADPKANMQIVPKLEKLPSGYWGHKDAYLELGTEVNVQMQHISDCAFDRCYGMLDIEMTDLSNADKEVKLQFFGAKKTGVFNVASIDLDNFIPVNIWQCPAQKAINYAPFWASVRKNVKAESKNGKQLDLSQYSNVFCYEHAYESRNGAEILNCQVYSSDTDFSIVKFKGQDLTVLR